MKHADFGEMECSMAQTLDVIGDRWTPLIVRDLYLGINRFDVMQRNMGLSRKVLTERLSTLLDAGVIGRHPYQDHPVRHDYFLTEKGLDLAMVMLAMKAWGDRWAPAKGGERMELRHESCGHLTNPKVVCSECDEELRPYDVTPFEGPGFEPGPGTSEMPAAMRKIQQLREAQAATD